MQRSIASVFLLAIILVAAGLTSSAVVQDMHASAAAAGSVSDYFGNLMKMITGDWLEYGELFTILQGQWFSKIFLLVITAVPAVFLLHYLIIGAKHFDHDSEQIYFFSLFARVVHFIAAVSFSLLVITGLMIIFGSFFGGGVLIRTARYIHLISAMVFALPGLLMFVMWFKEMLPQLHDIKWMFILGGYLSKKKVPVPAAKFNAGQKMYFWFATVGGGVMAYTGYIIWGFGASLDTVRIFTMAHNVLGVGIVAFFLTHCYMSVFAIAGSLESMKTGYKPKDEVDILHSLHKY
ncbi:formate dehydrogenase subunit gamma [Desulfosediminicola flagellatus]|uniref:formate dehydrogenase subunit gamma n=1 Tax=Desulfosediminicola flagellatus TaxID=2569541 RepID=UPI0010ACAA6E|nr:formate dehydrogenase subunit gamma [Desulfosediminicola flagellatus]